MTECEVKLLQFAAMHNSLKTIIRLTYSVGYIEKFFLPLEVKIKIIFTLNISKSNKFVSFNPINLKHIFQRHVLYFLNMSYLVVYKI